MHDTTRLHGTEMSENHMIFSQSLLFCYSTLQQYHWISSFSPETNSISAAYAASMSWPPFSLAQVLNASLSLSRDPEVCPPKLVRHPPRNHQSPPSTNTRECSLNCISASPITLLSVESSGFPCSEFTLSTQLAILVNC
jgi:hypothetical protein